MLIDTYVGGVSVCFAVDCSLRISRVHSDEILQWFGSAVLSDAHPHPHKRACAELPCPLRVAEFDDIWVRPRPMIVQTPCWGLDNHRAGRSWSQRAIDRTKRVNHCESRHLADFTFLVICRSPGEGLPANLCAVLRTFCLHGAARDLTRRHTHRGCAATQIFKRVFPPDLFALFIDIGHYQYDMELYADLARWNQNLFPALY